MLKDMDCQRVPRRGERSRRWRQLPAPAGYAAVWRRRGAGAGCAGVLQEAVLPTEHLSAPSTEQAPAAPQKKAGHSVNITDQQFALCAVE